jgi:hypothetical protein
MEIRILKEPFASPQVGCTRTCKAISAISSILMEIGILKEALVGLRVGCTNSSYGATSAISSILVEIKILNKALASPQVMRVVFFQSHIPNVIRMFNHNVDWHLTNII